MNRRGFLSWLGLASVAAVVPSAAPAAVPFDVDAEIAGLGLDTVEFGRPRTWTFELLPMLGPSVSIHSGGTFRGHVDVETVQKRLADCGSPRFWHGDAEPPELGMLDKHDAEIARGLGRHVPIRIYKVSEEVGLGEASAGIVWDRGGHLSARLAQHSKNLKQALDREVDRCDPILSSIDPQAEDAAVGADPGIDRECGRHDNLSSIGSLRSPMVARPAAGSLPGGSGVAPSIEAGAS